MTWLNAGFTIQDAIVRSQDVWDLYLSNWGNITSPSADGTSLVFPAVGSPGLPSVFAIGIGNHSHIDRCTVQWDIQKLLSDAGGWDYPRRVYCRSPLTFPQIGNLSPVVGIIPGNTNTTGSIAVYPSDPTLTPSTQLDSTNYANTYQKVDGTTPSFGSAVSSPAVFIFPQLHLQFYLKAPGSPIPLVRLPFYFRINTATDISASGTETLATIFPVHGRRRVVVSVHNELGPVTYRIGVLNQNLTERTAATLAGVAANTVASTVIEPILGDWITVYYTTGVTARVAITGIAED